MSLLNPFISFPSGGSVLTDSLIAYWSLSSDGTDSVASYDLSETAGGNAITFPDNYALGDGTNDTSLEIDPNPFHFGDGSTENYAGSISFMLYIEDTSTSTWGMPFGARLTSSTNEEFMLLHYLDNWYFTRWDSSARDIGAIASTSYTAGDLNVWKHFTVTWDASIGTSASDNMRIYEDAVEITTSRDPNALFDYMPSSSTAAFTVLGSQYNATFGVEGRMKGLGIWNKELSPAEVAAIQATQSAGSDLI